MLGTINKSSEAKNSFFSPSFKNMVKGTFAVATLGAMTGGLGYLLGGLQGLYWGLGINTAIQLGIVAYSREIVFWMQRVKIIKQGDLTEDFDLHQMVEELMLLPELNMAKKPLIGVLESMALNAFATGPHPGHAGIAVTRGLLKKAHQYAPQTPYSAQELVKAILIHELGHVVHRDITIGALTGVMASGIKLLNDRFYDNHFDKQKARKQKSSGSDNEQKSSGLSNVAVFLLGWSIPVMTKLLSSIVSRAKETHADETAFHAGYGKQMQHALRMLKEGVHNSGKYSRQGIKDLVSQLEGYDCALFCHHHQLDDDKLTDDKARNKKDVGWFEWASKGILNAFATHPPIESRVEHLKALDSAQLASAQASSHRARQ